MDPRTYGIGMIIEGLAESLAQYKANQEAKNSQIQDLLKQIQAKDEEISKLRG